MPSAKHHFLKSIRSLLHYHESSGIKVYPESGELQKFLKSATAQSLQKDAYPTESQNEVKAGEKQVNISHGSLDEIAEEIRICKSCDLCQKRIVPVVGKGEAGKAKLFIIGGWLSLPANRVDTTTIFGSEEDRMIERMLTAIGLTSEDAFISNVIKCGIATTVQPKAENISACLSYLHRQIASTSPLVICTMGIVAARSLLQISKPLSQLRGSFYEYHLGNRQKILVMPTYHPTFLLQNPEMKKATWHDLQAIAKELEKG